MADCDEEYPRTVEGKTGRRVTMGKLYEDRIFRKYEHEISQPQESHGECRNAAKKCNGWHTLLGDGLCVRCFDARKESS